MMPGEVIHQHLKTGFDLTVYPAVEVLNAPAAQRTCNHRAEEHRHVRATITPMVVMAPTTPPRSPPTSLPPV